MSIVLPILLAAILMGLFVRRMTAGAWLALAVWIALVIIKAYLTMN